MKVISITSITSIIVMRVGTGSTLQVAIPCLVEMRLGRSSQPEVEHFEVDVFIHDDVAVQMV